MYGIASHPEALQDPLDLLAIAHRRIEDDSTMAQTDDAVRVPQRQLRLVEHTQHAQTFARRELLEQEHYILGGLRVQAGDFMYITPG